MSISLRDGNGAGLGQEYSPDPRPRPCPRYRDGFRPRWGSVFRYGPAKFTSKIRNFNYTPPKFMKLCGNLKNIMDNMQ